MDKGMYHIQIDKCCTETIWDRLLQVLHWNHRAPSWQPSNTGYKGSKGLSIQQTKSGVQLQPPHSYLLRGQGFLWYTALTRAQIHVNVLYICSKIANQSDYQELSWELKLDDDNLFTYEEYNQLLWSTAMRSESVPSPSIVTS
jgi:hypothetical protein